VFSFARNGRRKLALFPELKTRLLQVLVDRIVDSKFHTSLGESIERSSGLEIWQNQIIHSNTWHKPMTRRKHKVIAQGVCESRCTVCDFSQGEKVPP